MYKDRDVARDINPEGNRKALTRQHYDRLMRDIRAHASRLGTLNTDEVNLDNLRAIQHLVDILSRELNDTGEEIQAVVDGEEPIKLVK